MDDLISRQAAIDALGGEPMAYTEYEQGLHDKWIDAKQNIEVLPSVQSERKRKKGKWDERSVFDTEDSDIAQMQSAKCSVCGKYHTTPYLYFFDNFNFCPNCGADMREKS